LGNDNHNYKLGRPKVTQDSRRHFVKIAAGAAISMIALRGTIVKGQGSNESIPQPSKLIDSDKPGKEGTQWVMVIDQENCVGCGWCASACKAVNDTPMDIWWNMVFIEEKIGNKNVFLPRVCMQCEEPACVNVCPVDATYKREGDGLVIMDYDRCIGCRYCMGACPYGSRYFNWKEYTEENTIASIQFGYPEFWRRPRGVVEKCNFCTPIRLDKADEQGLTPGKDEEATPACVNICPYNAIWFGKKDGYIGHPKWGQIHKDTVSLRGYQLRGEIGTKPRVWYLKPLGEIPEKVG
jgi:Fe-S-cluster-containing dehydrogenase component